jgi:RNA polymerase sigma-70 factor (ECF subfamily)
MSFTKQLHQPIIDKCKSNCPKAQMQLYNLYCSAMLQIAYRYVKKVDVAEDVMQDAFLKAFKNIENYKNEVAFGAWLKKIVINQSIDKLKKRKLELVAIDEELVTIHEEENDWNVEDSITKETIVDEINKLKEKYRLVLTLYLLEGFDHKEISSILSITENTSRTHLLRGKKQLQENLKMLNYAERY